MQLSSNVSPDISSNLLWRIIYICHLLFLACHPAFGLPWWLRWLRLCLQCGRSRFDPWLGGSPREGTGHPLPVFLPGDSLGQRSLAATLHGSQRVRHDWVTNTHVRCSTFRNMLSSILMNLILLDSPLSSN